MIVSGLGLEKKTCCLVGIQRNEKYPLNAMRLPSRRSELRDLLDNVSRAFPAKRSSLSTPHLDSTGISSLIGARSRSTLLTVGERSASKNVCPAILSLVPRMVSPV